MHSRNIREGMVRYSLGVKFLGTLWWVDNHVTLTFRLLWMTWTTVLNLKQRIDSLASCTSPDLGPCWEVPEHHFFFFYCFIVLSSLKLLRELSCSISFATRSYYVMHSEPQLKYSRLMERSEKLQSSSSYLLI